LSGLRDRIYTVRDAWWRTWPGRALAPSVFDFEAQRCLRGQALGVSFGLAEGLFAQDLRLEVDPRTIALAVPKVYVAEGNRIWPRRFFVLNGEWERETELFSETLAAVEMAGLIGAGDITTSKTYRGLITLMEKGQPRQHGARFVNSVVAIGEYCQTYVEIYEDMCANGYRAAGPEDRVNGEIGVAVGRDGTLFHFRKGHHRLALAQRANLERAVATVRLVHSEWLRGWIDQTGKAPHAAAATGLATL
tara:strand:+ start:290 stop:1033 length:744 start_codon:yes stop_codon:yes gene_type:complete